MKTKPIQKYIYLPDNDRYVDEDGLLYVLNEYNPDNPVFICVSGELWQTPYNGDNAHLDWSRITLTKTFKQSISEVFCRLMKKNAPSYLSKINSLLLSLENSKQLTTIKSFDEVSIKGLRELWMQLKPTSRSHFRKWYAMMADDGIAGASFQIAQEMKTWKAREELVHLRDVVNWHETKGSLTSAEHSLLKNTITDYQNTFHGHLWMNIYCWLLMDTLKRSSQILEMRKNSVHVVKVKMARKSISLK